MMSPQSSALRPKGPSLSSVQESAIAPCRLTSPYVGRSAVTPQNDAGVTIDPDVSDPIANGTIPAATAAPGPLDDPPDHRVRSHGFSPGPVNDADANRHPPPPASSSAENSFALSRAFSSGIVAKKTSSPRVAIASRLELKRGLRRHGQIHLRQLFRVGLDSIARRLNLVDRRGGRLRCRGRRQ